MRASSESKKYDKAVNFIKNRLADIGVILKLRPAEMNEAKLLQEKEALETVEYIVERRKPLSAINPGRSKDYACPRCGHHFADNTTYFCQYCGQHISYADEDLVAMPKEFIRAKLSSFANKDGKPVLAIMVGRTTIEVKQEDINAAFESPADVETRIAVIRHANNR